MFVAIVLGFTIAAAVALGITAAYASVLALLHAFAGSSRPSSSPAPRTVLVTSENPAAGVD